MNHPFNQSRRLADPRAPIRWICSALSVAFRPEIRFAVEIAPRPLATPRFRDGCRALAFRRQRALQPPAAVATNCSRHASPPR
jgi:hypothetical protein